MIDTHIVTLFEHCLQVVIIIILAHTIWNGSFSLAQMVSCLMKIYAGINILRINLHKAQRKHNALQWNVTVYCTSGLLANSNSEQIMNVLSLSSASITGVHIQFGKHGSH